MSSKEMLSRARAIRERLRNPPNAWRPPAVIEPPAGLSIQPHPVIQTELQTLRFLLKFCSQRFGVEPDKIISKGRQSNTCLARHVLCYLAYTHLGCSTGRIGSFLGRDHSTVMNGRDRVIQILRDRTAEGDMIRSIVESFLADHYPHFTLSSVRQQNMERVRRKGLLEQGICGLEEAGGSRVDGPEGVSTQVHQGEIQPSHRSQSAG